MPYTANQTTLRNISGVTKFFDFIGEHGTTLENGDNANIAGNIWSMWPNDTLKQASLLYAINNNLIEVIRTPIVVGFDETLGGVRKLIFDNSDVESGPPDYGSYSGTAP